MSPPIPVRLQTSVWNPMGARRALLLHGLGSDSAGWWRIASGLAEDGCMVLAPDLRSHGRSPTAVDHRLAALAEDVLLLGEGYDLVIGHSVGGAVAARLLTRPGFATAAVLIDPVLLVRDEARSRLRDGLRADVGELDFEELRSANPGWSQRDLELKRLAAARVAPGVVDAILDDNDPWDLRADAAAWTGKVHLMAADPSRDAMLEPDVLEALGDGDRITTEVVPDSGHSLHRERAELVLAATRALLA